MPRGKVALNIRVFEQSDEGKARGYPQIVSRITFTAIGQESLAFQKN